MGKNDVLSPVGYAWKRYREFHDAEMLCGRFVTGVSMWKITEKIFLDDINARRNTSESAWIVAPSGPETLVSLEMLFGFPVTIDEDIPAAFVFTSEDIPKAR